MVVMKRTNVTNLRVRLSRFLDAVRHGESIEILDRDVPIARLVPVAPTSPNGGRRTHPWLERLRRAGVARVGPMKGVPEIWRRRPPGPAKTGAVEAVLEERREGW
jgi:antitoxin (DNA-binding transcriptional repressor) of toxin-antitoxin stability system